MRQLNNDNHQEATSEDVALDGDTLDYVRSHMRCLAVEKRQTHVRIIAGDGESGFFYWGLSPAQARNMAADLLDVANAIQPIRSLN